MQNKQKILIVTLIIISKMVIGFSMQAHIPVNIDVTFHVSFHIDTNIKTGTDPGANTINITADCDIDIKITLTMDFKLNLSFYIANGLDILLLPSRLPLRLPCFKKRQSRHHRK